MSYVFSCAPTVPLMRSANLLLRSGSSCILHQHLRRERQHIYKVPCASLSVGSRWLRAKSSPATALMARATGHRDSDGADGLRWSMLLTPACMLLSAVLLCSSSPPPAEAGWWPFSRKGKNEQEKSPLDGIVPEKARKQRAQAEEEMRTFLTKMRVPIQELVAKLRSGQVSREDFDVQMASFSDEVEAATQRIIFGVQDPPHARRLYEAQYGKCKHTPEAIRTLMALSPLVEIEAGRGHWQRALEAAGATVVSFDKWARPNGEDIPPHLAPVGKVSPGDEHALRLHRDKTLILVCPPQDDTTLRCLREYRGDALVYVGEGRGGTDGCDEFFDRLDADWDVTKELKLDPFPQCFERLFVLRRKAVVTEPETSGASLSVGEEAAAQS